MIVIASCRAKGFSESSCLRTIRKRITRGQPCKQGMQTLQRDQRTLKLIRNGHMAGNAQHSGLMLSR